MIIIKIFCFPSSFLLYRPAGMLVDRLATNLARAFEAFFLLEIFLRIWFCCHSSDFSLPFQDFEMVVPSNHCLKDIVLL